MRIVICGGGVIGACLAWYLVRRGADVTVVERTAVAAAASGKSGGFLGLDWCDGGPMGPLARRSFALHAQLADGADEDWGYRRLDTFSGAIRPGGGGERLNWLSKDVRLHERLGTSRTTAQVDPARFKEAMMLRAEAKGAQLRIGTVQGVTMAGGTVEGVAVGGEIIPADAVVLAMGPWSALACRWLPIPAVYGLKGHSIVFETGDVPATALFLEAEGDTPEVFPRPDGTIYICGLSSETPLPVDPVRVLPDPGASEKLLRLCGRIAPGLAEARLRAAQACYRPITVDALPLIGAVPGVEGALACDRTQLLGHPERPCDGRGDCGTAAGRKVPTCRSRALRSRTPAVRR